MEYLNDLMMGFSVAMTWQNLMFALIGCILGTLVGVLKAKVTGDRPDDGENETVHL